MRGDGENGNPEEGVSAGRGPGPAGPKLVAIALDLDGTLLEADGRILADTLAALAEAAAAGVYVLLATGRPPDDVAAISARTGMTAWGLPHAAVCNERDLLLQRHGVWEAVQPRNRERFAEEYALSLALHPQLVALHPDLAVIDPAYTIYDAPRIRARGFIEFAFATPERAETAAAVVRARVLRAHPAAPQIVSNRRIFAVRHPAVGKGPNLAELCRLLRLDPRRVLAMGDAENDRSMLDGAFGFVAAAPANAEPGIAALVRQRGGLLARGGRGAGVAEVVRRALRRDHP